VRQGGEQEGWGATGGGMESLRLHLHLVVNPSQAAAEEEEEEEEEEEKRV
jgi:hypothetical protein